MNRINPEKLLCSKWTAINPQHRHKHFIVSRLVRDEDERVVACEIEAVIDRQSEVIDWHELQNSQRWLMGWK